MSVQNFLKGGGKGTDVSGVTATQNDVLSTANFVDSNGDLLAGTIPNYSGSNPITANGTISAGVYLKNDLTINVNPAGSVYRHLNYTIIQVTVSAGETITIKTRLVRNQGVKYYICWGDGFNFSTLTPSSFSDKNTTSTHTYTNAGTYNILFRPANAGDSRFLLSSANERNDLLRFQANMFGQSDSSPFTNKVKIFCGDSVFFLSGSLSYCTNIELLDFTNMNSLLESNVGDGAYFTQDLLSGLCKYSIIDTLIIGSGIRQFNSDCFLGTTCRDMIINDSRYTGVSTTPIELSSSDCLPTITGYIFVPTSRANAYKEATYWSALSSQIVDI